MQSRQGSPMKAYKYQHQLSCCYSMSHHSSCQHTCSWRRHAFGGCILSYSLLEFQQLSLQFHPHLSKSWIVEQESIESYCTSHLEYGSFVAHTTCSLIWQKDVELGNRLAAVQFLNVRLDWWRIHCLPGFLPYSFKMLSIACSKELEWDHVYSLESKEEKEGNDFPKGVLMHDPNCFRQRHIS